MALHYKNSLFDRSFEKLKVMMIVPHEDDEITIGGAFLYALSKASADITLVYATNGDFQKPAKTRIKEAVKSAGILGIPKENLIFLGYGDSLQSKDHSHLFYHHKDAVTSQSGHNKTYAAYGFEDYAYKKYGIHHSYTSANYLSDIISVITDKHPDIIISTDLDEHPDHRMLSLYIDKAVGIIKNKEPHYFPEIWKSFAYAFSYACADDFSAVNNPQTMRPTAVEGTRYGYDLIDKFDYCWEK